MTSKPTARDKFEELKRISSSDPSGGIGFSPDAFRFLLVLVEAAISRAQAYADFYTGELRYKEEPIDIWQEIDQRMAEEEGEK